VQRVGRSQKEARAQRAGRMPKPFRKNKSRPGKRKSNGSIDEIEAANIFRERRYVAVPGILPAPVLELLKVYFDIVLANGRFSRDEQCPLSLSIGGDPGLDAVLEWIRPRVGRLVGIDLAPTYSYARLYSEKEILARHTDRAACEISVSVSIRVPEGMGPSILHLKAPRKKETSVPMWEGDGCIYAGTEVEHWREAFSSDGYIQLFLHFISKRGEYFPEQLYDGRERLGGGYTLAEN
jgi:hypothetical protein